MAGKERSECGECRVEKKKFINQMAHISQSVEKEKEQRTEQNKTKARWYLAFSWKTKDEEQGRISSESSTTLAEGELYLPCLVVLVFLVIPLHCSWWLFVVNNTRKRWKKGRSREGKMETIYFALWQDGFWVLLSPCREIDMVKSGRERE